MAGATNYRKQMDEITGKLLAEGQRPSLLMHACCAPCSSSCLVQVREYFDITVFFFNPNITERDEYNKRLAEEKRLVGCLNEEFILPAGTKAGDAGAFTAGEIRVSEGRYAPDEFLTAAKGHETDPEGGERCRRCFELRLQETARTAAENGFDFFTTSLTLSPLKNAALLNVIGTRAGEKYGVRFLPSDFKKKDGYLLSLKLSETYDLYRQNYCGCIYSKAESKNRVKAETV